MKNYYYNQKTQDLTIFDTETKELLVLERLLGIRVLTSSDLENPGGNEPVKKWKNHNWDPVSGKAKKHPKKARTCGKCGKAGHRSDKCTETKRAAKTGKKRGTKTCKNCGEPGHMAKTCKNPAKVVPPLPEKLPDEEIENIAREERAEESPE